MSIQLKQVFYTIEQIVDAGGQATVDLFSKASLREKVGRAFFSKNGYAGASGGISQELTTFYLEDGGKSNLSFLANINSYDAVLTVGQYTYSITSGQGKYLKAIGTVTIQAFDDGMRFVTIEYKIPK
jgi:hypothetical protein